MHLLAIISFFIASLTSTGESASIDLEYISVCERCRELVAKYSRVAAETSDCVYRSELYSGCVPDEAWKHFYVPECKSFVDDVLNELVLFLEDLAETPESADEVCFMLRCGSGIFEDINLRVFKRKSKGNLNLACIECRLEMSEAMKVFEDPAFKSNFMTFALTKICPPKYEPRQCKQIVDHIVSKLHKFLQKTFADHKEKCKLIDACDREIETRKTSSMRLEDH